MLSPRKRVGIKYFYFLTNMNSNKVSAYKNNNRGSIYFVDKCFYWGVSLIGTFEVITDQKTKGEIWCDGDETFYPSGK